MNCNITNCRRQRLFLAALLCRTADQPIEATADRNWFPVRLFHLSIRDRLLDLVLRSIQAALLVPNSSNVSTLYVELNNQNGGGETYDRASFAATEFVRLVFIVCDERVRIQW